MGLAVFPHCAFMALARTLYLVTVTDNEAIIGSKIYIIGCILHGMFLAVDYNAISKFML